jgi:hypothetical protein
LLKVLVVSVFVFLVGRDRLGLGNRRFPAICFRLPKQAGDPWAGSFFLLHFGMLTMLASPSPFSFNKKFVLPQDLAVLLIVNFIFSSHNNSFFIQTKNFYRLQIGANCLARICFGRMSLPITWRSLLLKRLLRDGQLINAPAEPRL